VLDYALEVSGRHPDLTALHDLLAALPPRLTTCGATGQ